jgi:uncharacterized protein DUF4124
MCVVLHLVALAVWAVLIGPMIASLVGAQPLYRWTDEKGQAHMTDDINQVPERVRPRAAPPPAQPRRQPGAVEALKAIGTLVAGEPDHDEYARLLAEARVAVDGALAGLERGPLRSAMTDAMRCYREAGELWDNQLAVRRGTSPPLNMLPIRRAWDCGAGKTAEVEKLLAARKP